MVLEVALFEGIEGVVEEPRLRLCLVDVLDIVGSTLSVSQELYPNHLDIVVG